MKNVLGHQHILILNLWSSGPQAHPIVGTLARAPEPYNLVVTVLF
jgi:hypothetical protein